MTLSSSIGIILRLFLAQHRSLLMAGAACAALTLIAGIGLLGLSGWFITATAIAGLSTVTALVFDVFAPSAGIRLMALGRTGARYGERVLTHDATLRVLAALRERLFRGWAQPQAARHLLAHPARLLFRLTGDIDALDTLYLRLLIPIGSTLVAVSLLGLIVGLLHPWTGIALAAGLLLTTAAIFAWTARAAMVPAAQRLAALEDLRMHTIDLVSGQTELVMTGRAAAQYAAIAHAEHALANADDRMNRLEVKSVFAQGLTTSATLTAMLVSAALLLDSGQIDTPQAALCLLMVLAAGEPFAALRRGALELGRTLIASSRLAPRLIAEPAPSAVTAADATNLVAVSAQHEGAAQPVLAGITLHIAPGERVALVGASGAGKSTILALIAGEIVASAGHVEAPSSSLLTQRTELFQDSLRENLLLAKPDADDATLWQALELAGLASEVRAQPLDLDTPLGENGLGLSGGQARRLALARLFLRPAPLWLLDEPTEGLDAATAGEVLARLFANAGKHTVIMATHARRDAAWADRLLVVREGAIAADLQRGDPAFDATLDLLRLD